MEAVHKFEATVAGWYKNLPHLPKGAQKWIADNVWWLVLIAVVLGVFGAFTAFAAIGTLSALTAGYSAANPYYGYAAVQANVGGAIAAAWISLIGLIVTVVLSALAIAPLRNHQKKGWDLLFLSDIAYFVIAAVGAVVSLNIFGIVPTLLGTLVGFYFLFEIRSYFVGAKAPVKTEEHKKAEKAEEKK